jgi:transcription elongation factor GreA
MDKSQSRISIGEAVSKYLGGLPPEGARAGQQIMQRLVRWFGRERGLSDIKPPEVANFCGHIPASDAERELKLNVIHDFLAVAKKNGWTDGNLSLHVRVNKKSKTAPVTGSAGKAPQAVCVTRQGYEDMQQELQQLKEKRPGVIEDIRRAAADKDFRENAPLDAAREQLGHIDGRIHELEETLKVATIIDDQKKEAQQAGIGDCVLLAAVDSGEEARYTIVGPKEVNPARGRISNTSPLGKAIVGRCQGEEVAITVPAGTLRYRIVAIER